MGGLTMHIDARQPTFATSQQAFAEALLHAALPLPPGLTTARGEADAARFAVYRNNVYVGLTRALALRFPVTWQLVGEAFFTAMARAYAQDHKPASPMILGYGDDLPDFIAAFGPAAGVDYLADVARLEVAWARAYHAADAVPLAFAALAAVPPEQLPDVRLRPHPAASLISSAHPVGSIWSAHQGDAVGPVDVWQSETVLVVRPDMEVGVHALPARDAVFAAALFSGASLGEAAEAALAADETFEFGAALAGLHGLGAFAAIDLGDQP